MDMKKLRQDVEAVVKTALHKFEASPAAVGTLKQEVNHLADIVLEDVVGVVHNPIERMVLEHVVRAMVKELLDTF